MSLLWPGVTRKRKRRPSASASLLMTGHIPRHRSARPPRWRPSRRELRQGGVMVLHRVAVMWVLASIDRTSPHPAVSGCPVTSLPPFGKGRHHLPVEISRARSRARGPGKAARRVEHCRDVSERGRCRSARSTLWRTTSARAGNHTASRHGPARSATMSRQPCRRRRYRHRAAGHCAIGLPA